MAETPYSPFPGGRPDQKRKRLTPITTTCATFTPPTTILKKYSTMEFPAVHTTPPTFTLTHDEAEISKILVDLAQEIDQGKPEGDRLVLRFTGGWVRDKLLGLKSADIDVGINNMTGYDFAIRVPEDSSANIEKHGPNQGYVHRINSNPKKSKHLETATRKILGLDVDFVNLRSESYSEDSRIPQMKFGTPEEDALRRDCTINSLFYNLHTKLVEDFTGLGLKDLTSSLIRTPLPPKETFADDPLRVLRLIRFASRFGFSIDPNAKAAMRLPEIKSALKTKISRERVGKEIEKMFRGCNPHAALCLIHEVDLYNEIFAPPIQDPPALPVQDMKIAADIVSCRLLGVASSHPRISKLLMTSDEKYHAWLIAAMSPWKNQSPLLVDKKNTLAAATAIKEALKCPNNVSGAIAKAFANYKVIQNMAINVGHWSRGKAGLEMRSLGTNWKNQFGASLMFELVDLNKNDSHDEGEERGVMEKYEALLKAIAEQDLEQACSLKSLLNGNDVATEYSLKPGAWVKLTIEESLRHQLDNPHKGKDELLQWVRENREALVGGRRYAGVRGGGRGKRTR